MTNDEKKHRIKEKLIEENFYLTMSMIKEDTIKITNHKEKINKLVKEYLDLLDLPI